jgi:amino acid adenylation domain-containing protein
MQPQPTAGYRLSPQQARLWRNQQNNPAFRSQCALLIQGRLEADTVRDAIRKVVDRHEVLRTAFRNRAGMKLPLQVIHPETHHDWGFVDLSGDGADRQSANGLDVLRQERLAHFDIEQGPVLRSRLLRLAPERHILVLTLPSLCADSQTLRTMARELHCLCAQGRADSDLSQEPLQYADFAEWQNQILEADDPETRTAKQYWNRPEFRQGEPLRLPFGTQPVADHSFDPDCASIELPADILRQLESLANECSISAGIVLLACWQSLLARLTDQTDLTVWTNFDGRKQEELRGAMGLFEQALPIRIDVKEQSFKELVRQVGATVAEGSLWQEYFTQDESPASGGAHFEYQNWPSADRNGLTVDLQHLTCHLDRFAIKLSCTHRNGACRLTFHFDPLALSSDDALRTAEYFRRLLESVLRDPQLSPASVEIVSPSERQRLVVDLNRTATEFPHERCIPLLFEEQTRRTPDRPALVFERRQWTFAQLNARSNQLAHYLRRRGVRPNDRVGLCMERSADMIVGLLGILKAGGAYVPLYPELPPARLAYQVAETSAPLIVAQEKFREILPADYRERTIALDQAHAMLEREPDNDPEPVNQPDDLVYVIYTSGSTGMPKGVAVRHRNLSNYAWFIRNLVGMDRCADSLAFASVSTIAADLGNTCIFPSLLFGGCLHILPYDIAVSGTGFARYAAENPIDVLKITPSHLGALLADEPNGAVLPRRHLILGGEALSWELVRRIHQTGKCQVINHYGPTETTVGSITCCVPAEGLTPLGDSVPIGRPIANTEVYVLNSRGQLAPPGTPGELFIGGAGVAAGYLNQPEQTARSFVADAFAADQTARLYRTGDRVRYRADGNLEFLGRVDRQVKIRGFRVELGEIEAILQRHPTVRQSAVIAGTESGGADARLIAYVVPEAEGTATVEQLRTFLQEQLPAYMVPAVFVLLPSLPLTPNGKIDHRALPDPDKQRLTGTKVRVAPRNDVEEKLAAIWKEVLGMEQIGVTDDFFELGGHSLLATQVISRVRRVFELQLPLRSIFETPTVAGLAVTIAQTLRDSTPDEEVQRLLNEVEGLSDEEVERLLAAEMQQ